MLGENEEIPQESNETSPDKIEIQRVRALLEAIFNEHKSASEIRNQNNDESLNDSSSNS